MPAAVVRALRLAAMALTLALSTAIFVPAASAAPARATHAAAKRGARSAAAARARRQRVLKACLARAHRRAQRQACQANAHKAANRAKRKTKKAVKPKPATHRGQVGAAPPTTSGNSQSTTAPTPAPAPAPVASTAPCANSDLMPDPTNIPVVEAATLCLINQVRGQHGLPALQPNAELQQAAEEHNNDMVTEDYFSHTAPDGSTPMSRVLATGYAKNDSVSWLIGENIAWGTLILATPSSIVNAWVNSPDHLANILEKDYTDTGLAVAPEAPAGMADGQQGAIYTQDFGGIDTSDS